MFHIFVFVLLILVLVCAYFLSPTYKNGSPSSIFILFISVYACLLLDNKNDVPSSVEPMSGFEIGSALDFISNEKLNNITLGGVLGFKDLKREVGTYVVNTGKWHWVVVDILSPDEVHYFDPLGKPPEDFLRDFVLSFEKYSYNDHKIQHDNTVVCGAICLYYVCKRYFNISHKCIVDVLRSEYKLFGDSPSVERDHLLYQQVYTNFKILYMTRHNVVMALAKYLYETLTEFRLSAVGLKQSMNSLDCVEDMDVD